jgi:hypothetical protein
LGGDGFGRTITGTSPTMSKKTAFLEYIVGKVTGNEDLVKTIMDEIRALRGEVNENGDWIWALVGAIIPIIVWILSHCKAVVQLLTALL